MSLISSRIAGVRTKRGSPSVGIESLTESFRREVEAEARKATLKRFENSEFGKDINALPTFDMNELVLGKRLGKGGFSNVDEIRGILLQRGKTHNTVNHIFKSPRFKCNRNDSMAFNDIESRKFIADHCFRRSGDARYAIKRARREVLNDEEKVFFGLLDLAIETKFLSSLEHPNIIKLRAISSVDPFSDGYFLVLDRLYDTLQKRIVAWREKHKRLDSFWGRLRDRRGRKRLNFFEHRVERAYDLSEALKYLHGECIIHRDAKPENIGFDCRGDLKIFDFGSARELQEETKAECGGYNISKMTGSLRYMAPEVWLGKPYNSACDVYSFALIFWEILAMERPFDSSNGASEHDFSRTVFEQGARPHLNPKWPETLRDLLKQSWCHNRDDRLSMEDISKAIRTELVKLRQGDESGLGDYQRRRSTSVFGGDSRSLFNEVKESVLDASLDKSRKSYAE